MNVHGIRIRLRFRCDRRIAAAGAVVVTIAATLTATSPARSAADAAAETAAEAGCPPAFAVRNLEVGQAVSGLTVARGTTPERFTGEVLGVLDDGIAPGLDMILTRLSSDEIDRVGGIWAGMSGSPVYASNGRLIGAVAYGLALGPSTVAGLTPAADMRALLRGAAASPATGPATGAATRTTAGADRVAISDRMRDRLVASGAASADEAAGGLARLPLPVGISGMANTTRLRQAARRLGIDGMRAHRSGAADPGAPVIDIVAGGNVAASLSYGDLTAAGVGTATAVCGEEVLAFGHPMLFSGPSQLSMHGASAVLVQEDPTLTPFKVANLAGPSGAVLDDRLAALRGVVGSPPAATRVTADVTSLEGGSRVGTTRVSVASQLPFLAAFHLLVDQDRVFDGIGPGSATVGWTVRGTRADGRPFAFSRTDRYASAFDITFETIFDSLGQLDRLANNRFTDVTITTVAYRSMLSRQNRFFRLTRLEVGRGSRWVPVTRGAAVRVRPGQVLRMRVVLTSFRNAFGSRRVVVPVRIPARAAGSSGTLQLRGGDGVFDRPRSPGSFQALLGQFRGQTRNDELLAGLQLSRRSGRQVQRTSQRLAGDVVRGNLRTRVRVVR